MVNIDNNISFSDLLNSTQNNFSASAETISQDMAVNGAGLGNLFAVVLVIALVLFVVGLVLFAFWKLARMISK